MGSAVARVLRIVSILICAIAILSFLLFAVNRTSTASGQQQRVLSGGATPTQKHESGARRTLDEITESVSSPVGGLSSSEWGERALRLIFVLLVFGFAVGYIARVVRVRA